MGKFGDKVGEFSRKFEGRIRAIARTAVQSTISDAQRTRGEGGRMRVDTGFLRASIQAALNGPPSGPTTNEGGHGGKRKYAVGSQAAGEPVAVVLLKWDLWKGDSFYVGWTANYARPREFKDGFLRGAAEKWDANVAKAVKQVEASYD